MIVIGTFFGLIYGDVEFRVNGWNSFLRATVNNMDYKVE